MARASQSRREVLTLLRSLPGRAKRLRDQLLGALAGRRRRAAGRPPPARSRARAARRAPARAARLRASARRTTIPSPIAAPTLSRSSTMIRSAVRLPTPGTDWKKRASPAAIAPTTRARRARAQHREGELRPDRLHAEQGQEEVALGLLGEARPARARRRGRSGACAASPHRRSGRHRRASAWRPRAGSRRRRTSASRGRAPRSATSPRSIAIIRAACRPGRARAARGWRGRSPPRARRSRGRRPARAAQREQRGHHPRHLLLGRAPVAAHGALDLLRRVGEALDAALAGAQHRHATRLADRERGPHVGAEVQRLERHRGRRVRQQQLAQRLMQLAKTLLDARVRRLSARRRRPARPAARRDARRRRSRCSRAPGRFQARSSTAPDSPRPHRTPACGDHLARPRSAPEQPSARARAPTRPAGPR